MQQFAREQPKASECFQLAIACNCLLETETLRKLNFAIAIAISALRERD